MTKIRIGILGPSDIGFRRFLPAVKSEENIEYTGLAVANLNEWSKTGNTDIDPSVLDAARAKAETYVEAFGGVIYNSYEELLASDEIDCVYIPLPPALHFKWAKKAIEYGKHVLLEKPFTTNLTDTKSLTALAEQKKLALHENYAFCYHNQIKLIKQLIDGNKIGEVRLIRSAFGFPFRGSEDFRYNKELGGGSLLDCGGYPVKITSLLLGQTAKITAASLSRAKERDVDIFGSVTLENEEGIAGQVAFGMDNAYKCELEIWGSEGCIHAPRIFTAPADFKPKVVLKKQEEEVFEADADDQFLGSFKHFYQCIFDDSLRKESYREIEKQSKLIDDIRKTDRRGING